MHFKKAFDTEYGHLQFYFNEIDDSGHSYFHISTIGKENRAIIFQMKLRDGRWYLLSQYTDIPWLKPLERKLSDAILEQSVLSGFH
jgi:hypothetical protein